MLWLLVGRGVAIESGHQVTDPLWQGAWDVNFSISSRMITLLYQVAVGNIVTGLYIADDGYFQCLFQWMLRTPLSGLTGYARAPQVTHPPEKPRARNADCQAFRASQVFSSPTGSGGRNPRYTVGPNSQVPPMRPYDLPTCSVCQCAPNTKIHLDEPSLCRKICKPVGACSAYSGASLLFPGHFVPAPFFNEGTSIPGIYRL
jgi:Cytochrome bd terminal oxidase subunit II